MIQIPLRDGVAAGPGPFVHPENETFWRSIDEGKLRLQKCSACGTIRFPVAPCCWRCLSMDHQWVDVDADGTVAVAVLVERATGNPVWQDAVPFLTGLVDTHAGIRLPGRILCRCGKGAVNGTKVGVVRIRTRSDHLAYAFEHNCEGNMT